jgi:hypothetical protein
MRSNYNDKAINALFLTNTTAQNVLKELSTMPRQDETLIENFEQKMLRKHEDVSRRDIVSVFKRLEEYGAGEFIPGRRGHPSRFRWGVDSLKVGDEKEEPAQQPVPAQENSRAYSSNIMLSHHYQLRPDLIISVTLPADISTNEAHRLGQFINSLPFQHGGVS